MLNNLQHGRIDRTDKIPCLSPWNTDMGQRMNNIPTGSHSTWGGNHCVDCQPLVHLLIHNRVTGIRQIKKQDQIEFLGNKTDMLAGNIIPNCVVEEWTGNILMHRPCISRKPCGRNHANAASGGIGIIGRGRHNIKDVETGWRSNKETKRSDVSNAFGNESNALLAAANATATAVVAVAIATAEKLISTTSQATSQLLHIDKIVACLYSYQGQMDKKDRNEV